MTARSLQSGGARRLTAALLAFAAGTALASFSAAQEPILFSEDSAGIVELSGHNRLEIRDIRGTISVRVGKEGELRYMCRARDNRRTERPIALWIEGHTLTLRPLEGREDEELLIEVAVAPDVRVRAEVEESKLLVYGLQGALNVTARNATVDVRGVAGSVEVEARGGSVRIENAEQDVTLDGKEIEAELRRIGGFLTLTLRDSTAKLNSLSGSVEADLDQSTMFGLTIQGAIRADASGGSIELRDARRGGNLRLDETTLVLAQTRGLYEVETNADVEFQNIDGPLHVNSFGGALRGTGSGGAVRIVTSDAEVLLENMGGETRIEGSHLKVRVKSVKGDLHIDAIQSEVEVLQADGKVEVRNEFGDVTVRKASKAVRIDSSAGNVRAYELRGPLELRADGNQVDVSWTAMGREKDSFVENRGGDLIVVFPMKAGCRIDAQARNGRVESRLPGSVRVSDDGRKASGSLGRVTRPTIQLRAAGNLYMSATASRPVGN